MSTTRKIAIGLGVVGGVLLTAYLLTGNRKEKTKEFIAKTGKKLKNAVASTHTTNASDDSEPAYI